MQKSTPVIHCLHNFNETLVYHIKKDAVLLAASFEWIVGTLSHPQRPHGIENAEDAEDYISIHEFTVMDEE